jgi:hypothetical protein
MDRDEERRTNEHLVDCDLCSERVEEELDFIEAIKPIPPVPL